MCGCRQEAAGVPFVPGSMPWTSLAHMAVAIGLGLSRVQGPRLVWLIIGDWGGEGRGVGGLIWGGLCPSRGESGGMPVAVLARDTCRVFCIV